jgi:hypothetical protein
MDLWKTPMDFRAIHTHAPPNFWIHSGLRGADIVPAGHAGFS